MSPFCANAHRMQKTGEIDWILRYRDAPFFQRDCLTGANQRGGFEYRRPKARQKFLGMSVQPMIRLDDGPAGILGLGFAMQNFT